MTLPLPLRNRLAELILDAFRDPAAREGLEALAGVCADARALEGCAAPPARFPADFFERGPGGLRIKGGWRSYEGELCERARRARQILAGRPLDPPDPDLETALGEAGALFDAGLFFEVHEMLESYWMRAEGAERETLQGLIQVAVGFHHLSTGNVSGARALLHDGCAKTLGQRLSGRRLDPFARAVRHCLDRVLALGAQASQEFDWSLVPRFPERGRGAE
ncbi:MAG TPA: DUF309 domain-containing protein [Methylomirabilota bacterium]|nr:DUF309 domain-containing protein [Methylomirabilota bacterium]